MTLPEDSLQFFYPKLLLVILIIISEFCVILFFQRSIFSQKLCCSESKGIFCSLLHEACRADITISSQVCLIRKLAVGKRPTAVYCQYWTSSFSWWLWPALRFSLPSWLLPFPPQLPAHLHSTHLHTDAPHGCLWSRDPVWYCCQKGRLWSSHVLSCIWRLAHLFDRC